MSEQPTVSTRRRGGVGFEAYALPGGLVALVAALLLFDAPDLIREIATWQSVAQASAIGIVVAVAMVVPLRAGEFNLGIGSTVGLSAIAAAAAFTTHDLPLFAAVLIGLGFGALMGAVSGFFVAYLGVNSLIATLGLGILAQGLAEWYSPGTGFSVINATQLTDLFSKNVPGIEMPAAILIALAIAAVAYYLIEHVPFGRYLTAIGSNKAAATLVGIRVERTVFAAYVISGVIGGIGGILVLGSFGSVSAQVMTGAGVAYWLPALAAVYLGATAFQPGRFNVAGAVVAIILVKLVRTLFTLAKVSEAWPENVVNGAALVIAVAFSSYFARRRSGA